jgi:hypothetical protein
MLIENRLLIPEFASISKNMEGLLMATEIETLRVLKILGDVFPSYKLSSSAIEIYVQLLADIPGLVLEKSALDHISHSSFFPSIAELRSAAFSIIEAADPVPTGYEAWSDVQAEIQRIGHRKQPQFDNPIAAQVVKQLGWRYLCLSENPVADRAHFVQAYQAIAERQRNSAHRMQIVDEFIDALKSVEHPKLAAGEQGHR